MRAGAETGEAVRCSLVRLPRKAFANCYCFGREASPVCRYMYLLSLAHSGASTELFQWRVVFSPKSNVGPYRLLSVML